MPDDASAPREPRPWTTKPTDRAPRDVGERGATRVAADAARTQPCLCCGHPMPALKGGTASICGVCGFKDSCCY